MEPGRIGPIKTRNRILKSSKRDSYHYLFATKNMTVALKSAPIDKRHLIILIGYNGPPQTKATAPLILPDYSTEEVAARRWTKIPVDA